MSQRVCCASHAFCKDSSCTIGVYSAPSADLSTSDCQYLCIHRCVCIECGAGRGDVDGGGRGDVDGGGRGDVD